MKSAIASNVKKLIRVKCLKQSAIAAKAGYNQKTFSNMLNGRKLITDVDVAIIANALGVSPGELFAVPEDHGISRELNVDQEELKQLAETSTAG